jgi:hypothetical protein
LAPEIPVRVGFYGVGGEDVAAGSRIEYDASPVRTKVIVRESVAVCAFHKYPVIESEDMAVFYSSATRRTVKMYP